LKYKDLKIYLNKAVNIHLTDGSSIVNVRVTQVRRFEHRKSVNGELVYEKNPESLTCGLVSFHFIEYVEIVNRQLLECQI
jgi:hypothetical protein